MRKFNWNPFARRRDDRWLNEMAARYEGARRSNAIYSLPFEATQLYPAPPERALFVLRVGEACKALGKQIMIFGQVRIAPNIYIAATKRESTWIPVISTQPSANNSTIDLADIMGPMFKEAFLSLLASLNGKPGIYEVVPGLALFSDAGNLKLTASTKFVKIMNNETRQT